MVEEQLSQTSRDDYLTDAMRSMAPTRFVRPINAIVSSQMSCGIVCGVVRAVVCHVDTPAKAVWPLQNSPPSHFARPKTKSKLLTIDRDPGAQLGVPHPYLSLDPDCECHLSIPRYVADRLRSSLHCHCKFCERHFFDMCETRSFTCLSL